MLDVDGNPPGFTADGIAVRTPELDSERLDPSGLSRPTWGIGGLNGLDGSAWDDGTFREGAGNTSAWKLDDNGWGVLLKPNLHGHEIIGRQLDHELRLAHSLGGKGFGCPDKRRHHTDP